MESLWGLCGVDGASVGSLPLAPLCLLLRKPNWPICMCLAAGEIPVELWGAPY